MTKKKKLDPQLSVDILSKADMIKDLFIDIDYLNKIILKADVKLRRNFNVIELVAILEQFPSETNSAFDTIYERIVNAIENTDLKSPLKYKKREVIPDIEYGGLFSKRFLQ